MSASTADEAIAPAILMLPVDQLTMGLDFRVDDDPDDVADLAVSIREVGVLQPLTVRQVNDGWEVVAGRRRLSAARIAGLDTVPCVLRTLTDDEAIDVALAENLHRRNLSAIEQGLAFARLRDQGLTQTQIAHRVGRSQNHVSMLLRVLELPEELRQKIHRREMSYVTALDRWGRKQFRETGSAGRGGVSTKGSLTGGDADLVTHWRRRHDRLLAGLLRLHRARADGISTTQLPSMIAHLVELDQKPLTGEAPCDHQR